MHVTAAFVKSSITRHTALSPSIISTQPGNEMSITSGDFGTTSNPL